MTYTYDNLNRLTGETNENASSDGYTAAYIYDIVGNRLFRSVTADGTLYTDYYYNELTDQLTCEVHSEPIAAVPFDGNKVYAYATASGSVTYKLPGRQKHIGQFTAFLYGLPSVWNEVLFYTLMVLIPLVFFGPLLVALHKRRYGRLDSLDSPDLKLWHRMLCVLLSYIFLIGPEAFHALSQAAIQYSQISTLAWGAAGDIIDYGYDSNGSLTSKTTKQSGNAKEQVIYEYNLQNRISKVTTSKITNLDGDGTDDDKIIEETCYQYNPSGIRTSSEFKLYHQIENNTPQLQTHTFTDFLIDPSNFTGYAQVLEETTYDQIDTDSASRFHYAIGSDVISQTKSTGDWDTDHFDWTANPTQYFLYDGHGSTRQLLNHDGSIQDTYSYDGYGVSLAGNPTTENPADTNLLYCGEQYDNSMRQYYLRARYYNPANGVFNQIDPFSGNMQDPQSLHKYLYVHNNPINNIDPSGMFIGPLVDVVLALAIRAMFFAINTALRCVPVLLFAAEVALAAMLASAIVFVLEETGFLPKSGYMEAIFWLAAMVYLTVMSAAMFIESFRSIVEPVRNSSGQIITSKEANKRSISEKPQYANSPPYKPKTLATEGKIAPKTDLVRCVSGTGDAKGRWTMPRSEVQGLSPREIQNKYAMPSTPTHYSEVDATGINARVGVPANNFGSVNTSGVQVELLDEGATFGPPQPLPVSQKPG